MFNLAEIKPEKENKPPRIVIYGPPGIGKSTFGSTAPNPFFMDLEDGVGHLKVSKIKISQWPDVMALIQDLCEQDHKYQTLVVDSIDWLEPMIWEKVASDEGKSNIEEIGYGKGYVLALNYWMEFLSALSYLRDTKNMAIILIAHHQIRRYDDPTTDSYDRHVLKLHKTAGDKVVEWADAVLFAGYKVFIGKEDAGFNKKVKKGKANERVLFTEEQPAFVAKNHYGLPPQMAIDWNTFVDAMFKEEEPVKEPTPPPINKSKTKTETKKGD